MIIYPAMDLRGGKVVRLRGGDPAQQTVYSEHPLQVAEKWIGAGAEWLHVINLDGAFEEQNAYDELLEALAETGVPIQFGGGLRSFDDLQRAFDLGVSRAIVGTLAVEQPDVVTMALARYGPEAIAIALDARGDRVTLRGWQEQSEFNPVDLGKRFAEYGARYALYTDISRDGQLEGVNVEATVHLARATGLEVIASGGANTLMDIIALRDSRAIHGVILGTALYEGLIDLSEAIRLGSL